MTSKAPLRHCAASLALIASVASISPLFAATPKAWFKADSLTVANNAAVSLWSDSSRSGNLAQASNAPYLAATAMNGFPAVHFSGNQSMVFPRPVMDDFSIMVLFRTPDGAGSGSSFYNGAALVSGETGGVTDDYGMCITQNGRVRAGTGNPDRTISTPFGSTIYDDDAPQIATFTRTRSSGELKLYMNGALSVSSNFNGTQALNIAPQLSIGAHPNFTGPFFNGDIAEIIVLEGALTASEQLASENALRGKYALPSGTAPLPATNPIAAGARLTWTESIGAKTYQVYRAPSATGPFTLIAQNLISSEFIDPAPLVGQSSFYQIVAVNNLGSSAASATVEGISPVLPVGGPVIINEIHYNGLNNAIHSDFIEIYNFSTTPADVSGWSLSSGVDYTFPAGTTIAPGGFLVVAQDPSVVFATWGATALGPYLKSLSSDGETVRLRNAANLIVSEVTYSSGFPWPCAANGDGASMELINPTLDTKLGSSWRSSIIPTTSQTGETASPGSQNYQFRLAAPPAIQQVSHLPLQPTSSTPITVTAKLSDPDGIASAQLAYQIVAPGNHIPAYLPLPIVNNNISTGQPRPLNPAFENPANWTTVTLLDNGTNGDLLAGDGIYTATIPSQAHRSLVRYRVIATDIPGNTVRAPYADDESKNFALFVYNGVPDYQGVPAATLQTLPVYQFLTRKADYDQCYAYNPADRLTGNTPGWTYENWEATIVFDGIVYDHIKYRLHGGNGRYNFTSKRGMRFFFNKGYDFQNRDNDGNLLPTKWNSITTENCWENRGTLTYCLNEMVNFYFWRKVGIPAPRANWGHFRTVTTAAEQADAYHGDFWGLIMIHEDYDGDFLDSHNLEKGNLYKLTRDETDGPGQQRYQAANAVSDGSDHQKIYSLNANDDEAYVRRFVNFKKWSEYHAICQAVRHYDYWPTGDNNAAYYFQPDFTDQVTPTDQLGKLWVLPNDVDATWGPTWNEGKDVVYESVFGGGTPLTGLYPTYFNAIREVRDLLWQQNQINPLLDQFAAVISPFVPADNIRWKNAPADAGNYNGLGGAGGTSLANLVTDMKNFAWSGGSWPGGNVGAGGTAAFMDNLQLGVGNSEGSTIPLTPITTYQGPVGFPTNALTFSTSAFADPQGTGDFSAVQWRVAEVTDPTAPAYDPLKKFKLEWEFDFDSGPLTTFNSSYTFPGSVCKTGRAYRVRVRHIDLSGRWSHWSPAVQFIAGPSSDDLPLVISEFLYKPNLPTSTEIAAGFTDAKMFEYVELRNVGTTIADLSGCKFNKGIAFTFPPGSSLSPGASTLIVANPAAFAFRYGPGRTIAGTNTGSLDNSGEQVTFASAADTPLIDFTYKLASAGVWPIEADTLGSSLILINPNTRPDPKLALNWRASPRPGGAPGFSDDPLFATWASQQNITTGPEGDDDLDGIPNSLEYALITDPKTFTPIPAGLLQPVTVGAATDRYLTTTFKRLVNADDVTYHVLHSDTLATWSENAVKVTETNHYDGTATETWRAPTPVGNKGFLRISISPP